MTFFSDLQRNLSFDYSWDQRNPLEKAYTAILIVFIIGLLPMPYGYYFAMRAIVCLGLFFFLKATIGKNLFYVGVIIGLLILYNPIFHIHLGDKIIWSIVNLLTVVFLYFMRSKMEGKNDI